MKNFQVTYYCHISRKSYNWNIQAENAQAAVNKCREAHNAATMTVDGVVEYTEVPKSDWT